MKRPMILHKTKTALLIIFAFSFLFSLAAKAQPTDKITINGTITAVEDGAPLPGVNILIKGTTQGAITNTSGDFTIASSSGDVLVFSSIGYITREVTIDSQSRIDLAMESDVTSLSEVVVIGYGTQKKSHVTASVSKVTNDQLDQVPVSRMDEALAGTMAGVQVSISDANLGQNPTIKIRGTSSMTTDSDPLLVIDGVPVSGEFLGTIDMNDVASIEVLKDASSAAIYGSRGAAGVIMITTKQGKSGKTKFNFNAYYGVKSAVKNDRPYPELSEWIKNTGSTPQSTLISELGTETDWFNTMVDGGSIQDYSLSAEGGNNETNFHISGSYLKDEGVLLTDAFEKFNARINLSTKVNNRIEMGFSISPGFSRTRAFPMRFHDQIRQSSWLPIYHTEHTISLMNRTKYPNVKVGDYVWEDHFDNIPTAADEIRTSGDPNPYQRVVERNYQQKNLNLLSNAFISVKLLKDLTFRSSLAIEYHTLETENRTGVKAHKSPADALTATGYNQSTHWIYENYFSYDKQLGAHEFNAILGFSAEKTNDYESGLTASGYLYDYIPTISDANTITSGTTSREISTLASFFGRINYALSEKYLASVSLRRDGSSRFGDDSKWGLFPAFSAGWRISNEEFLKNSDLISELKLRVSYGINGQDAAGRYAHLGLIDAVSPVLDGSLEPGFAPSKIGNSTLQWQKSKEFSPGIDIGLFDNRIFFSAEYYNKTSEQLLLDRPVSAITGFTTVTVNQGVVRNKGIDIELSTNNVSTTVLSWKSSVLFSTYHNELMDFAGADSTIFSIDPKRAFEFIAIEGQPISSYYGYEVAGEIDPQYIRNPLYPIGGVAQDSYVVDQDGDGEITSDDKVILGDPHPDFTWSLVNTFRYKQVDLSFTFSGSHGAKVVNMDRQYIENHFHANMDYNPAVFPAAERSKVREKIFTDYIVQDGSYVALRTINLGYTIPAKLSGRIGIENLRLYAAASNAFVFMSKDYTGYNPEGANEGQNNPLTYGYQRGSVPLTRAVTFGVNLSF